MCCFFYLKYCFRTTFKAIIVCLFFFLKGLRKIFLLNLSPFNTCVTLLIFEMNHLHSCLWEVVDREVVFKFNLLSKQDRKQYCIDMLNFCFHPPFLPFPCVPSFNILGARSSYITILFVLSFQALIFFQVTSHKPK